MMGCLTFSYWKSGAMPSSRQICSSGWPIWIAPFPALKCSRTSLYGTGLLPHLDKQKIGQPFTSYLSKFHLSTFGIGLMILFLSSGWSCSNATVALWILSIYFLSGRPGICKALVCVFDLIQFCFAADS